MKKIIFCTGMILLLCTGCSNKKDLQMAYSSDGGSVQYDIGNYVEPAAADFITEQLCFVGTEENAMQDEKITAVSSLMFNVSNQEVIFANNVYERIYPASTTKILTALLALKYSDLKDTVTIQKDNAGITVYGAKLCNFKAGDVITMETLLNCLLVYSGNDAGVAIAEHISGSEEAFAELMNEEAAKLGAVNTHFVNSSGLHDPNHYTTAYDMYLIFKECLNYDLFTSIIKKPSYTANYLDKDGKAKLVVYETTNMFLLGTMEAPDGITVFGGKTGSTSNAGDCLLLYSEDNEGNGYITEVFKASSKNNLYTQMAHLLEKNSVKE